MRSTGLCLPERGQQIFSAIDTGWAGEEVLTSAGIAARVRFLDEERTKNPGRTRVLTVCRTDLFADAECKEFFPFNRLVTYRGRVGVKLTKSTH